MAKKKIKVLDPPDGFKYHGDLIFDGKTLSGKSLQVVRYNKRDKSSSILEMSEPDKYGRRLPKLSENGKYIYNDKDIAVIFTKDLFPYMGEISWCLAPFIGTAYESGFGFNQYYAMYYLNRSPLYLFVIDGYPTYLASNIGGEFKHFSHNAITNEKLNDIEEALWLLISHKEICFSNNNNIREYRVIANYIFNKIKNNQKAIKEFVSLDSSLFVNYCRTHRRKRWKSLEYKMLKNKPRDSFEYMRSVAQQRVPCLEGSIAGTVSVLRSYRYFLTGQAIPVPEDIERIYYLVQRGYRAKNSQEMKDLIKIVKERAKQEVEN